RSERLPWERRAGVGRGPVAVAPAGPRALGRQAIGGRSFLSPTLFTWGRPTHLPARIVFRESSSPRCGYETCLHWRGLRPVVRSVRHVDVHDRYGYEPRNAIARAWQAHDGSVHPCAEG